MIKSVKDKTKRKSLDEILSAAKLQYSAYEDQCSYINDKISQGEIVPIKSSPSNGKKPPLQSMYRVVVKNDDFDQFLNEIEYELAADISKNYYRKHIDTYKKEREKVLLLSSFLKNNKHKLQTRISCNERSFQIWRDEKYLAKSSKTLLRHCKISTEILNYYDTSEPFAYFSVKTNSPQTILFIENKDTFYTIRNVLLNHKDKVNLAPKVLGQEISTVIYAAGKRIEKSIRDFMLSADSYLCSEANNFLYFGDLDYVGIDIYEKTASLFPINSKLIPFLEAYNLMLVKSKNINLPNTAAGQKTLQDQCGYYFFSFFDQSTCCMMRKILTSGLYIPQEIITYSDLQTNTLA